MFEHMLESRRAGIAVEAPLSLPIAVLLHVALLAAGLAASFLAIREIEEPGFPTVFVVPTKPPTEPPPPPAGAAAAAARPRSSEQLQLEIPQEPLQPQDVPDVVLDDVLDTGRPADSLGDTIGSAPGPGGLGVGDTIGSKDGVPGGTGTDVGPRIPGHDGVTNPELQTKVQPDYPEMARLARTPGRVILQAVIEPDGSVGEIEVLRCNRPNFGFEDAAIGAVKQWRYRPATQNGRPVAVYFTVMVEFRVN